MMFTNNRDAYRKAFATVWQKHQKNISLDPQELQLLQVMLLHPEYESIYSEATQAQEYSLEENPYIHLSLHLTLREQIALNRPKGMTEIYNALMQQENNAHTCEHEMMNVLANLLWQAQQSGNMPSEEIYLQRLQMLIKR